MCARSTHSIQRAPTILVFDELIYTLFDTLTRSYRPGYTSNACQKNVQRQPKQTHFVQHNIALSAPILSRFKIKPQDRTSEILPTDVHPPCCDNTLDHYQDVTKTCFGLASLFSHEPRHHRPSLNIELTQLIVCFTSSTVFQTNK